MTEPREVELKLEISGNVAELMSLVGRLGTAEGSKTLVSVYFDTPTQALRKAGASLRVRHDGDRRVQTVKAESAAGAGLFDRAEWEMEIDGDDPVPGDTPLRKMVGSKTLSRVEPVFRSIIDRSVAIIAVADADLEVAVDQGQVVTATGSAEVCEAEIELRRGSPKPLFALARQLGDVVEVRLGVLTKAERGYRLLDGRGAAAAKAEAIDLDPGMSAAAALQAIAWSCLRHFRLNEGLLAATGDAGALHQARVGLRRLRSALSVFTAIVADERSAHLRGELRWLAAALGEARDIDVLLGHVDDGGIVARLETARADAYHTVRSALASPRARGLMIDLAEWLTVGAWLVLPTTAPRRDQPVAVFAANRLQHFRKRLKKLGAGLAQLDDEQRHAARIAAKKLRYATEFFAALFTGNKAVRRHRIFRDELEVLQGYLGDLNDEVTAAAVLHRLGIETLPGKTPVTPGRDSILAAAVSSHQSVMRARRFW